VGFLRVMCYAYRVFLIGNRYVVLIFYLRVNGLVGEFLDLFEKERGFTRGGSCAEKGLIHQRELVRTALLQK